MKTRSVLYVDDEEINLELFSLSIGNKYPIICAESGNEALDLIHKENIGILITDMKMPGMNGIELIHEVKKTGGKFPCAILSGYQQNQEIIEALDSKLIIRYIMKPFVKDEMLDLIREYLD